MRRIFLSILFSIISMSTYAQDNKTLEFVEKALNSNGCVPAGHTCKMDIPLGADFLNFLQNCKILQGWEINYQPKNGDVITSISGDSQGNCIIKAIDSKNLSILKQCTLTYDQYQNVASDDMINAMRQYDTNGTATPDVIKAMTPIANCLGDITINRVNTK